MTIASPFLLFISIEECCCATIWVLLCNVCERANTNEPLREPRSQFLFEQFLALSVHTHYTATPRSERNKKLLFKAKRETNPPQQKKRNRSESSDMVIYPAEAT